MRWIGLLGAFWLLAACNTASNVGEGPLILHPRAAKQLETWQGPERLTDMTIAVDRHSRFMFASHCEGGAGNCLDDVGQLAMDGCNNRNPNYECFLLFYDDDIVWKGPIFVKDPEAGQTLPYHGRWPVTVTYEDGETTRASSVVAQGRRYVEGLRSDARCTSRLTPRKRRGGLFRITCPDGWDVAGTYSTAKEGIVRGEGRSSDGRELTFTMDIGGGEGLPPFSGY